MAQFLILLLIIIIFFFVNPVLAATAIIFAGYQVKHDHFRNSSIQTEPASQIPEEGQSTNPCRVGKGLPGFGIERAPSLAGVSALDHQATPATCIDQIKRYLQMKRNPTLKESLSSCHPRRLFPPLSALSIDSLSFNSSDKAKYSSQATVHFLRF